MLPRVFAQNALKDNTKNSCGLHVSVVTLNITQCGLEPMQGFPKFLLQDRRFSLGLDAALLHKISNEMNDESHEAAPAL